MFFKFPCENHFTFDWIPKKASRRCATSFSFLHFDHFPIIDVLESKRAWLYRGGEKKGSGRATCQLVRRYIARRSIVSLVCDAISSVSSLPIKKYVTIWLFFFYRVTDQLPPLFQSIKEYGGVYKKVSASAMMAARSSGPRYRSI